MNRPFFALWILVATLVGALIVVGPARSQTNAEVRMQNEFPCFGSCPAPSYGFASEIAAGQTSDVTIPLIPFYLASNDEAQLERSGNASEPSEEAAIEDEEPWDTWLEEELPDAIVQDEDRDTSFDYDDYSYEDYDYEYDYDYAYDDGNQEGNSEADVEAPAATSELDGAEQFTGSNIQNELDPLFQTPAPEDFEVEEAEAVTEAPTASSENADLLDSETTEPSPEVPSVGSSILHNNAYNHEYESQLEALSEYSSDSLDPEAEAWDEYGFSQYPDFVEQSTDSDLTDLQQREVNCDYDFLSLHDAPHDTAVYSEPLHSPETDGRLGEHYINSDSEYSVKDEYEDEYSGYGAYDYEAELYGFDQPNVAGDAETPAETDFESPSAYDELYGEDWSLKDEQYELERKDQTVAEENQADDDLSWVESSSESADKRVTGFPILQATLKGEESSPITSQLKKMGTQASDSATDLLDQIDGNDFISWMQGTHQSTLLEKMQSSQQLAGLETSSSLSLDDPESWDGCDAWFRGLEKSRVANRKKSVLDNLLSISDELKVEQFGQATTRRALLSLAESMDRLGDLLKSSSYTLEDLAWDGLPDLETKNIASRETPAAEKNESR